MPAQPIRSNSRACADSLGGRGRRHARDHRHPAGGRLERDLDHAPLLRPVEIGELAGRAERRQAVHAGRDQVLAKARQHLVLDPPGLVDRRDQVREHAVEPGRAHRRLRCRPAASRRSARRRGQAAGRELGCGGQQGRALPVEAAAGEQAQGLGLDQARAAARWWSGTRAAGRPGSRSRRSWRRSGSPRRPGSPPGSRPAAASPVGAACSPGPRCGHGSAAPRRARRRSVPRD